MVVAAAACAGEDELTPGTRGGNGSVIVNKKDADTTTDGNLGRGGTGGQVAMQTGTGGRAGAGGRAGSGGRAGTGGAIAGAGGAAGSAGAGGAAGVPSSPPDDPCTACEKARCSHPAGFDPKDKTSVWAKAVGAWTVCFGGTGWPSDLSDEAENCGGLDGEEGPKAASGPRRGTAKTTLCQELLTCLHESKCTGGQNFDYNCYCGGGVDLLTCQAAGFVPTGPCKDQVAAAIESDQFANAAKDIGNTCLASGSAFFMYNWCDANCCLDECGVTNPYYIDKSFCNAPEATGGAGTGGAAGTTGAAGTSGSAGKGGTTGVAGSSSSGNGGTTGAAGATSGAAGASTTGAAGAGGAASVSLLNPHFDSNVDHWTAGSLSAISRSPMDAAGSGASGSLDLATNGGSASTMGQVEASQCVAVTGGTGYLVSVKARMAGASAGQTALALSYFTSADCSGSSSGMFTSQAASPSGWQTLTGVAQIPANIRSMLVRLVLLEPAGQPAAEALFDDVVVSH